MEFPTRRLLENIAALRRPGALAEQHRLEPERQRDPVNHAQIFPDPTYQRTNRAIFTKLQYLFRNGGSNELY